MVSTCFWGRNRGPLVPVLEGTMTALVYWSLLQKWLLPLIYEICATIGDPVFQQDNAQIHVAKVMKEWFDRNNIILENHPPLSPDLNLIEHGTVPPLPLPSTLSLARTLPYPYPLPHSTPMPCPIPLR